jgi:hypothetical protein
MMNDIGWLVDFGSLGTNLAIVFLFLRYQEKFYKNHMSNISETLEKLVDKINECPYK